MAPASQSHHARKGPAIRRIRLGLIALAVFLIPLLVNPFTLHPVSDLKNTSLLFLSGILLFLHGVGLVLGERHARVNLPLLAGCGAVAALILCHMFLAPNTAYSIDAGMPYLALLILAVSISLTVRHPHDGRLLLISSALSALAVGVYGLLQTRGIEPMSLLGLEWQDVLRSESPAARITSTLGNSHYVGVHLTVVLFLILACVSSGLGKGRLLTNLALCFIGLVLLAVIYYTRARSAVLGVLCGGFYLALTHPRPNLNWKQVLRRTPVMLALAISAAVLLVVAFPRFNSLIQLKDQSFNSRLLLWQVSGQMWQRSPWLGIGIHRFPAEFEGQFVNLMTEERFSGYRRIADSLESLRAVHAHNECVQYLTEFGILGLAVWLWLFTSAVVAGAVNGNERASYARRSVGAAITCILGASLFSFPLHLPATALLFYLCIGLLMTAWDEPAGEASPGTASVTARVFGAGIGLAAMALGSAPILYAARNHDALQTAGLAYQSLRHPNADIRRILPLIDKALARRPYDGEIRVMRGIALASMDRFNEAIKEFNEAEKDFSSHTLYFYRGKCFYFAHQQERAEMDFRKVLLLDSDYPEIHLWLGKILYEKSNYAEAAREFRNELTLYPNNADARALLGLSLYNRGDYEGSEIALLRAIELDPNSIAVRERLGDIYADHLGNLHEAIVQYEMAATLAKRQRQSQALTRTENKLRELIRLRDLRSSPAPSGEPAH